MDCHALRQAQGPHSLIYHRSNTTVAEHFNEQGMWYAAVDDVSAWDAAGKGYFAAVDFWEHAAGEDACCFERADCGAFYAFDEC